MAYRLKPEEPVDAGLVRLAAKQLRLGARALQAARAPNVDRSVHVARRHIKKARAIGRLVEGSVAPPFRPTNRRWRRLGRQLGAMTDAAAVTGTLARLRRDAGPALPRQIFLVVHKTLLRRKHRVAQRTCDARVLQTVARELRREERLVRRWKLRSAGFAAMAPGLRRIYRSSRHAMAAAAAHPTSDRYHAWRRRAKEHWLAVRLLEGPCGTRLAEDARRLEALDGYLGEIHNCAVLQQAVRAEAPDSRQQTATILRLLRRYERGLRRQAQALGAQIYLEKPRQFTRRVQQAWGATESHRWPRAA